MDWLSLAPCGWRLRVCVKPFLHIIKVMEYFMSLSNTVHLAGREPYLSLLMCQIISLLVASCSPEPLCLQAQKKLKWEGWEMYSGVYKKKQNHRFQHL